MINIFAPLEFYPTPYNKILSIIAERSLWIIFGFYLMELKCFRKKLLNNIFFKGLGLPMGIIAISRKYFPEKTSVFPAGCLAVVPHNTLVL
jgi:hypothetical protein